MKDTNTPSENTQHCGLVAIVGAPNAGKSTLVNALVGQKIAIISPKAQTTRARLMGIALQDQTQILLVDTPGIFTPKKRFDRAMVAAAWGSAEGANLVALVVDASSGLTRRIEPLVEAVAARKEPKVIILNKVDITPKAELLALAQKLYEAIKPEALFMVSATTGDGVADLKHSLADMMPESPWHFPEDQVSDVTDRMLAAEITREQIFLQLHDELPYAAAVETEKYEERKDGSVAIHQQILIARDSQKAIVVGHHGARLKEIGSKARAELSQILGCKVHLFLHVKVSPRWDEDRDIYNEIGLEWVK
ncbi:GTP-binding protein Era [Zymomonas mobilis subsp. mobilis ZM4 = ATCC 31821]|uniref:GTPase Era n=2 Tax=Zymomonas mobilis TaxID=542 RepID=Q5NMQ2_ZYMMO|nr:GTPase Era [Zymomonas mobilis]AAV90008.1 GTP-binding protein Era [Zymomonas mobilis subsp. mobilis ZM4 = ATCC 31821]AHB11013.1 GTP-binding protein Era [Zymomonas mobilis subsp. mobilis str. CP4 = NRRL B-14023]AHJ71328.1 GTPase Era [Zymomonas mobilis subsp. mobilis NRRL B-12526]AHJ73181.1 GTPase Era [Zymomonas mobilis subsp. mobilis str. CP4 = NRRL B-14023]ART94129.1 GTPase Era [Zymomonas mobilis subsp. mobilis]